MMKMLIYRRIRILGTEQKYSWVCAHVCALAFPNAQHRHRQHSYYHFVVIFPSELGRRVHL